METVSIDIPASPVYLRVVRLVAAGLASRLRFTIDEIDDLKIAVDELSAYLTGSQGRSGHLVIDFKVHEDKLEISGRGDLDPGQKVRTELTNMSRIILDTLVDSATLRQRNGSPEFVLVKSKNG